MSTARDVVVAQLAALDLDDVVEVRPYNRLNRQPAKVALLVRVDEVAPAVTGERVRTYGFSLILLGTKSVTDDDKKGGVDDELDTALETVLDELDKGTTDLVWITAKRGTYEPTNSPCYIIDTSLTGTYESE